MERYRAADKLIAQASKPARYLQPRRGRQIGNVLSFATCLRVTQLMNLASRSSKVTFISTVDASNRLRRVFSVGSQLGQRSLELPPAAFCFCTEHFFRDDLRGNRGPS